MDVEQIWKLPTVDNLSPSQSISWTQLWISLGIRLIGIKRSDTRLGVQMVATMVLMMLHNFTDSCPNHNKIRAMSTFYGRNIN